MRAGKRERTRTRSRKPAAIATMALWKHPKNGDQCPVPEQGTESEGLPRFVHGLKKYYLASSIPGPLHENDEEISLKITAATPTASSTQRRAARCAAGAHQQGLVGRKTERDIGSTARRSRSGASEEWASGPAPGRRVRRERREQPLRR